MPSAGTPKNTLSSSALKVSWALATETSTSSQTLEGLESTFSFYFSPTLSLLLKGGSSSTNGVSNATLAGAEVGEDGSTTKIRTPLSVIRTNLVLKADKGSSFLPLILAYISLLNFVVISARINHLSKNYLSKHRGKMCSTDGPKTYSFFLQCQ